MPPAAIERQHYLATLPLPENIPVDPETKREIAEAKRSVAMHADQMRNPDNQRRFALQVLQQLDGTPTGNKDNQFFAGRLVLVPDKSGQNWAWSMTARYPVIEKIPADLDYVVKAHQAADRIVNDWTWPSDVFQIRLQLAWAIARHFTDNDDVLISDVARFFKIAAQDERFWGTPARRNFQDVPEAVFIANLINWRRNREISSQGETFELVPATLNQAHGPNTRAFFVPSNAEGTVTRPMIYLRRHTS